MININTNLSSLIVQSNLKSSTSGLNTAIERLTTGYKINHAKDNAANYSISTSLSSKLSSYQVAQDNAAMGLDLLTTASDSINLITSHLQRMRDLAEQAANGTYGKSSLSAIQSEIDARTAEINRITSTTEYNGIKLFGEEAAESNSFVEEVTPLTEEEALAQGYTIIKTADELQAMQDDLDGKYILMNNIDLSGYDWTTVGEMYEDSSGNMTEKPFTGELNGNGYVIKNLTINETVDTGVRLTRGLFGYTEGATIQNVGIENVNVSVEGGEDAYVGGLVGAAIGTTISNCYTSGSVSAEGGEDAYVGGLVGLAYDTTISNCYTSGSVSAEGEYAHAGGLAGYASGTTIISNCYTSGSVSAEGEIAYAGGLVGYACLEENKNLIISNCYTSGSVSAEGGEYAAAGGLVGLIGGRTPIISNCYTSGSVSAEGEYAVAGGLVGGACLEENKNLIISNCYTSGSVSAEGEYAVAGGLVGYNDYRDTRMSITNSYTTGSVSCYGGKEGSYAGGLAGYADCDLTITNGYYNTETTGQTIGFGYSKHAYDDIGVTTTELNKLIADGTLPDYSNLNTVDVKPVNLDFQVGIYSSDSSKINTDTSLNFGGLNFNVSSSDSARSTLTQIDNYLKTLNEKSTELGSAYNRLESAVESIGVNIENLTSTNSTIKDADISEVSSDYIKMQILQQASATLLATANQTPALALQLL